MHLMQLTAGKKDDFNIARLPEAIQLGREQKYWHEQQHYSLSWPSTFSFPRVQIFVILQAHT